MKPWKPRPLKDWPEELKKIRHLSNKKWEKAVARLFVEDELKGQENIKAALDKRRRDTDN